MGLGRKGADEPKDHFWVQDVPVMVSGRRFLEQALNAAHAKGWVLRHILTTDKHDHILIVWERPTPSPTITLRQ